MDAQSLIHRYRDRLAWSYEETQRILTEFVDRHDLLDDLRQYLIDETGLALEQDDDVFGYRGKPFAVLGFAAASDGTRPDERIDTDTEVLALEAFADLLNRHDLEHFVVVQFRSGTDVSRELLRYDRRTSVGGW